MTSLNTHATLAAECRARAARALDPDKSYVDPRCAVALAPDATPAEQAHLDAGRRADGEEHLGKLNNRIATAARELSYYEKGYTSSTVLKMNHDVRKLKVLADVLESKTFKQQSEVERSRTLAQINTSPLHRMQNVPRAIEVTGSPEFGRLDGHSQGVVHGTVAVVLGERKKLDALDGLIRSPRFQSLPASDKREVLATTAADAEHEVRFTNARRSAEVLASPAFRALEPSVQGHAKAVLAFAAGDPTQERLRKVEALIAAEGFALQPISLQRARLRELGASLGMP